MVVGGVWLFTEGVRGGVAGSERIVIAVVIVVEAGLLVVVLTREPEWCGRAVVGVVEERAPQCRVLLPGEASVGVDEFGGRADEVGDDSVEPLVEPCLVGLGLSEWRCFLSLGDGGEAAGR